MFIERFQRLSKNMWMPPLGLVALVMLFLTGCAATIHEQYRGDQMYVDNVQYLSAYGEWVDYPPYGVVWLPDVVSGWEPFYYGHWIWTGDGWAWTSYEPYGWLVYHYGYWGYEPGFGWFWVPGDTWWPARVQWYTFGNYTAWAPIPPPNIVWPDPWAPYDVNVWIIVDIDNFTDENIGRHRIVKPIRRDIVPQRTVVRRPPDHNTIERITRRAVRKIRIREEETKVKPRVVSKQSATAQRRESGLKRMVLPKTEERKVEKHVSRVVREVLKPRKKSSEKQRSTRESSEKQRSTRDRNTDTKRRRK
ncbi:MAG: hypothetical protein JSV33_04995 [bacterium]|nr:MAG: hypothetical protein JSV33_04995 [bacterium]